MGTMSTVSSVSSTSSSGSSSRASLRSASIVSSCTIPLDEEDEETGNHDLTSVSATLVTSGQHSTTPQPLASSQGTILSRKMNKLPEETQCELLAQQLLDMLSTNVANNSGTSGSTANNSVLDEAAYKKLVSLIGVPSNPKTSFDFMEGILNTSESNKDTTETNLSPSVLKKKIENLQSGHQNLQTKRSSKSQIPASSHQIKKKKEELISRISTKLEVLRAELTNLKTETKTNEEVGRQITVKVMQVAQPNECEKYKLHVEEIDKITSLLLGLAARLARAENAFALCTDQSEKEQLRVKRDKLADQLEEAKKLKQNIDKRSFTVLSMLRKYLSEQLLANYDKFIKTKARLIMETRQLNDKVALSEEQKTLLKET